MGLVFLVVILFATGIFSVRMYNMLVRARFLVKEAYSGIDVQLKRRHDLIPKIVDTVKGYAQYEKTLLEKVTSLRSQFSAANPLSERIKSENELAGALRSVFALSEAYPDLKANQSFLQLQSTLSEIEDQIQMSRRYYNGTVRDYNVLTGQFPSNIIASFFNFKPEGFFELEYATQRQSPDVTF
ncbi:MAG: LemA family protein [Candidatus Omnitrophota bacterium]